MTHYFRSKNYRLPTLTIVFVICTLLSPAAAESEDAAVALTRVRMSEVIRALKDYKKLTKRYPSGLTLLLTGTVTPIKLSALLKEERDVKDGWDKLFVYQTNNDYESFRLISLGADGKRGGTELDADLVEKSFGFNPRPDQFDY